MLSNCRKWTNAGYKHQSVTERAFSNSSTDERGLHRPVVSKGSGHLTVKVTQLNVATSIEWHRLCRVCEAVGREKYLRLFDFGSCAEHISVWNSGGWNTVMDTVEAETSS